MSLTRTKRSQIQDGIVKIIGELPVKARLDRKLISEQYGVSLQTIAKYLKSMEKSGRILVHGKGREQYFTLPSKINKIRYSLSNLDEDTIWRKDIKPILIEFDENTIRKIAYIFNEMTNNAIEHSEGKTLNISYCINEYSSSFIIKDDGVGIFNKVSKALNLSDTRFAILELSKGKFTTEPNSHTGEGIFFSSKISDFFCITSGGLEFITGNDKHEFIQNADNEDIMGTEVMFQVINSSRITIKDVFEKYSERPDGYGFIKTIVPVKLLEYGEDVPTFVSRSQAKRLLARVERFQIIMLDFTGIDSIGQGFADEIFRVFVNEHPNVQMLYCNCNEDVERMIKHVMINN